MIDALPFTLLLRNEALNTLPYDTLDEDVPFVRINCPEPCAPRWRESLRSGGSVYSARIPLRCHFPLAHVGFRSSGTDTDSLLEIV